MNSYFFLEEVNFTLIYSPGLLDLPIHEPYVFPDLRSLLSDVNSINPGFTECIFHLETVSKPLPTPETPGMDVDLLVPSLTRLPISRSHWNLFVTLASFPKYGFTLSLHCLEITICSVSEALIIGEELGCDFSVFQLIF